MSMDTDRIEADVNESRHRISDTLDELGSKLSPGQVLDEALGLIQGQAGSFASKLGRQVMDNPMPAALIGTGLVWLIAGASRGQLGGSSTFGHRGHDHDTGSMSPPSEENESGLREGLQAGADKIRDTASHLGENARHHADDLRQKASDVRHGARDLYQDNPLVGGAISFALGALIAALAPLSQTEQRNLGGVASDAMRAGADLVTRGVQAAKGEENEQPEALH